MDFSDIEKAAHRLHGVAHHTPVMTSQQFNALVNAEVFFKCEQFQRAGAFKFRGAYNALVQLDDAAKRRGVVAFSSGNHAQAVALAARLLSIDACIVMPHDSPMSKRAAAQAYGAAILSYDRHTENRETIAQAIVEQQGRALIPPYNNYDVIAGQGTAALELIEEIGQLDSLFTCIGGGGLAAGTVLAAKHLLPNCAVIGVEPEAGNDAAQSLRAGTIVNIAPPDTIADGARTQALGTLPFSLLHKTIDNIVDVSDNELLEQMRFFYQRMKIVVEPTGALAAAGLFKFRARFAGQRIGVLISGGNVDNAVFARALIGSL